MFSDFLEVNKKNCIKGVGFRMDDEVFPLGKIGALNVLYAPLLGKVCICDNEFSKFLSQNLKDFEKNTSSTPDTSKIFPRPNGKFTNLSLFLNSDCNLRCVYCYARAGESKKIMDFELAKIAIDFITEHIPGRLSVLFHGGGEPTLTFNLMKKVVEYIKLKTEAEFDLQTNGVFSDEVREWLLKNMNSISISCDGPPHIQDAQRPLKNGGRSSPIVERNIRYFVKNSKNVSTLTAISEFSVDKQNEILEYLYRLGVKTVRFNVVQKLGRCLTCQTAYSTKPGLESFANIFLETLELADIYGIELLSTISFNGCMNKHCDFSGSFSVTPDGFLSPCVVVNSKDSDFTELLFGHLDKKNKKIILDEKKLDFLNTRLVQNIATCKNCFMKWNCAGGCPIDGCLTYGKDIFSPDKRYCSWVRKLGRELLFYKVQKDLIKIKPFLEEKSGRMIYRGIFNTFELAKFPSEGQEVILKVDINKTNLASLANEIIRMNPRLILLSFKLSKENLKLEVGNKIEEFLRTLKSSHIPFIIIKPLPKCLFDQRYEETVKEFRIPKNCDDCLELFTLRGDSFHICKTGKSILQNKIKNRKEICEYFADYNKRILIPSCERCVYSLRRKCNGLCL